MSALPGQPAERGLLTSLAQHAGGGFVLVGLVAVLFVLIGTFGSAGDDPLLAVDGVDEPQERGTDPDAPAEHDGSAPEDEDPVTDDAEVEDPPSAPEPDEDGANDEPAGREGESEDGADDTDGDEAAADTQETASDDDEAGSTATDADADAGGLDPAAISVQVLDGFQADGGTAADAVARELEAAGYRIIARNPALRYEVTTVLWTSGNEAAARQVAAAIGAAEVRAQPGNLSESVSVHVVVGADRG